MLAREQLSNSFTNRDERGVRNSMEPLEIGSSGAPGTHSGRTCTVFLQVVGISALILVIAGIVWLFGGGPPDERLNGKRQVLVMRHCLRRTIDHVQVQSKIYRNKSDYTSHPGPDWGVPQMWCTQGGMKVIQSQGVDLKRILKSDISRLSLTVDTEMRDPDTALALLKGLKRDAQTVEYDPVLFNTIKPDMGAQICHELEPPKSEIAAAVRSRVNSVPKPMDIQAAKAEMEKIFGVGKAGSLMDIEDIAVDDRGHVHGAVSILKIFAQDLLYTYGSGIQYLGATPEQIFRLARWVYWMRSVKDTMNAKVAIENAALLAIVLQDLASLEPGVSVYIGHDGNLDGLATLLDLRWIAPPYVVNEWELFPTPPGSFLLFEYDGASNKYEISFVYTEFDGSGGTGSLQQTPVLKNLTHDAFQERVLLGLRRWKGAENCYNKAHERNTKRYKHKGKGKGKGEELDPPPAPLSPTGKDKSS